MSVAELPKRHEDTWARATRHPFLSGVRDGTLPPSAFDVWLAQDYRFVAELLRFQARLLGRAPRSAQAVLAAGAAALVDELAWFERQAAGRRLDLGAAALPATAAYGRLLERLDHEDFAVALAMLWALERTYLEAWTFAAPGAPAYREYVAHWTTPQFAHYVDELAAAADTALTGGHELDAVFAEVAEAEVAFWDMALVGNISGSSPGRGEVRLSEWLWRDSTDLATAARQHPFVRGLADGTLDPDRFAGYIAQDAFFLESFARAYAFALAHSRDRDGLEAFADLLTGVRQELRLHASYADRLGIDLSTVEAHPATLAYTEFLLATAARGEVGQTCAAMTPCMRLYAYLGQSLASARTSETYVEWIDTYADPEFEALASTLERLLDAYADDVDRARDTYRRAMHLELDFFDAALPPNP